MKSAPLLTSLGKKLMAMGHLRITIADDEATYFNEHMLRIAESTGYRGIKRLEVIDKHQLNEIMKNPPDIIILDVKGVCTADVAKDGIELANMLARETSAMVVVTSAHKFHLKGAIANVDHIIERRNLTAVDFTNELSQIVGKYLDTKARFYRHLLFRAGFALARGALQ